VKGKTPELWDPETGTMRAAALFDVRGEETRLPLELPPHGAVFVVFREAVEAPPLVSLRFNSEPVFPIPGDGRTSVSSARAAYSGDDLCLIARETGNYTLTDPSGKEYSVRIVEGPDRMEVTGDWQIDFPAGWGAPDQIVMPELISWTDSEQDGVKYFSGIATYHKKMNIPRVYMNDELILYVDLGKVREVVEIYLNGESLGILWKPPYRIDITQAVKPGENTLTLEVANTWSNRLTGDDMLPESERYTKTNITGPDYLTRTRWKDAPLLESGVLGPVSIQFARKIVIK
jgi:hypothetical protein